MSKPDELYDRIRETVKYWKGWSRVRALFWAWVYKVAYAEIMKLYRETRGLIEKPDACPDEIDIDKE